MRRRRKCRIALAQFDDAWGALQPSGSLPTAAARLEPTRIAALLALHAAVCRRHRAALGVDTIRDDALRAAICSCRLVNGGLQPIAGKLGLTSYEPRFDCR